ncbi:MAG: hypothetical protein Q7K43_03910, partial [Candidatus Woesearchaeota archaeon]|nr:hypothetical protein [Candidatus Woesearchaeota archaeon]
TGDVAGVASSDVSRVLVNDVFFGTYTAKLDAKNRLIIPSELYQVLEYRVATKDLFIRRNSKNGFAGLFCFSAIPPQEQTPSELFFSYFRKCGLDAQRRLLLTREELEYSKLLPIKKKTGVLVTGAGDYFCIWNRLVFEAYEKKCRGLKKDS